MKPTAIKEESSQRIRNATARRAAIVESALSEFVEKGFAAARMEDIARRAGVAKGTIYLNFSDKEELFEAIVKQEIRPNVDNFYAVARSGVTIDDFVNQVFLPVLADLTTTRRGAFLRMLIGEASRFPKLAEVYYRVVIEPGLEAIRLLLQQAKKHDDPEDGVLAEFPQLLMAPMLLAVIWSGLFQRFRHLDTERMARVYFDHMIGKKQARKPAFTKKAKRLKSRHG